MSNTCYVLTIALAAKDPWINKTVSWVLKMFRVTNQFQCHKKFCGSVYAHSGLLQTSNVQLMLLLNRNARLNLKQNIILFKDSRALWWEYTFHCKLLAYLELKKEKIFLWNLINLSVISLYSTELFKILVFLLVQIDYVHNDCIHHGELTYRFLTDRVILNSTLCSQLLITRDKFNVG